VERGELGLRRVWIAARLAGSKRPPFAGGPFVCVADYAFVHFPWAQQWAHFAPVQFCFVQWVQSFCLPPLPAKAAGPARTMAVMAKRNTFLIFYLLSLR